MSYKTPEKSLKSNQIYSVVGAFNQEKALVGAFSVIVQPVVEPMDRFTALLSILRGQASIASDMRPILENCQTDLVKHLEGG